MADLLVENDKDHLKVTEEKRNEEIDLVNQLTGDHKDEKVSQQ